ncbi:hypothetical protein [Methyloversatilis sp. RAC08]|uniref:hypothetical protein n=1 Tax=Methyloversatilis sp. RAC08 TaxID=1842540 RepID=UPI0012377B1A|nr:hypothetical protein [Methyloversatilis sp. RAC08]
MNKDARGKELQNLTRWISKDNQEALIQNIIRTPFKVRIMWKLVVFFEIPRRPSGGEFTALNCAVNSGAYKASSIIKKSQFSSEFPINQAFVQARYPHYGKAALILNKASHSRTGIPSFLPDHRYAPRTPKLKRKAFDYQDIAATIAGVVMTEVHHHAEDARFKGQIDKPSMAGKKKSHQPLIFKSPRSRR